LSLQAEPTRCPITVIGERIQGAKSEFAKVRLTLHPAKTFEVEDRVEDKEELEKLNVGWPDSFILGMLDVLMNAEPDPLTEVRVTLERVWYHDADSSREAFRNAGHDAAQNHGGHRQKVFLTRMFTVVGDIDL
jgi:hypothetical protein